MTTSSDLSDPVPVPIRVLLPGDREVVAHLWSKRQVRDGWLYEVGLPAYRNGPNEPHTSERRMRSEEVPALVE
ncbi:hypothetical protein [Streptomyces goshikiensis]|uniref:hypothetical protein n=1 Tax=Streptomyces goshikiensis TaxID=1942 RepID=UPI003325029C